MSPRVLHLVHLMATSLILFASMVKADEVLTLQGPNPRLSFEDNEGITQIWDLFADHTGFDIVDSIAGTAPFHIDAAATSDSLIIRANGNIGFGTAFPQELMHVQKNAIPAVAENLARFSISDDSVGRLTFGNNSATNGIFHPRIQGLVTSQATALSLEGIIANDIGANPAISFNAARSAGGGLATRPLVAYRNNGVIKVLVSANGDVTATSFSPSSSRAIKKQIALLDSDTAREALQQLLPVEYVYKADLSGEKRLGFIAEDVPELVANTDRKSVPIMDVVALVTRVVKDQQDRIDSQSQELEHQRVQYRELQERLSRLEGLLSKLPR